MINGIIHWCNANSGFLLAVLSFIGLVLSATAIIVSIRTAKLPYMKKLLLSGSIRIDSAGKEAEISAANVGNRAIKLTYIGYAVKRSNELCKINSLDGLDFDGSVMPADLISFRFHADEIIKDLSGDGESVPLFLYATDTEGTEYVKRYGTVGELSRKLKE
ncbi:MAG: hypothetical protein GX082_15290 [Clostridiaceae bacterium]|nr:hypothetical protein [Clostridiaceae bacterium]